MPELTDNEKVIHDIALMIAEEALRREGSDLVRDIYSVWLEVGALVGYFMGCSRVERGG